MCFTIFVERKNSFLGYKNNKFKKSKNWDFSKGVNPWFWLKIGHFSIVFFLCNISQENVFYDILERKNAFLGYKNKKFNYSKNWHFFKRLTHDFGPKLAIFPTFFSRQYRPGKYLLRCSRTINVFLGYKNKNFKKSKNWLFSKGVNAWFWSKNGHFSNFFFR